MTHTGFLSTAPVERKLWVNINGGTISHLKDDSRYPDNPSNLDYIINLEVPTINEEGSGQTLTSYFIAPETGGHVFYMACDDQCQLLISNDTDSKNAQLVINILSWTTFRNWEG